MYIRHLDVLEVALGDALFSSRAPTPTSAKDVKDASAMSQ
jgi:hypothetical protein